MKTDIPVPVNNGWPSSDGSTVKVNWLEDGAHATVHIIRKKTGVAFRVSRSEAEVLRRLMPAERPD